MQRKCSYYGDGSEGKSGRLVLEEHQAPDGRRIRVTDRGAAHGSSAIVTRFLLAAAGPGHARDRRWGDPVDAVGLGGGDGLEARDR